MLLLMSSFLRTTMQVNTLASIVMLALMCAELAAGLHAAQTVGCSLAPGADVIFRPITVRELTVDLLSGRIAGNDAGRWEAPGEVGAGPGNYFELDDRDLRSRRLATAKRRVPVSIRSQSSEVVGLE